MTTERGGAPASWSASESKQQGDDAREPRRVKQRASVPGRVWRVVVWGAMGFFLANVVLLVATVAFNSLARRWFGTLLPQGYTCIGMAAWRVSSWRHAVGDGRSGGRGRGCCRSCSACRRPMRWRARVRRQALAMLLFVLPLMGRRHIRHSMATAMYQTTSAER